MATNEDTGDKGGVWVLDQQLDQPMDEEAKRLRNMYREKVFFFPLLQQTIESLFYHYN